MLRLNHFNGRTLSENTLNGLGKHEVRLSTSADAQQLFAGTNGVLLGLDAFSLSANWQCDLPEAAGKVVSVLSADNSVVYAGAAGILNMINQQAGNILFQNTLSGLKNEEIRMALSADQQCMYIGTNGYAIGTSEYGVANMDKQNWMDFLGQRIASIKLRNLLIPGAHDAGSYNISKDSQVGPDGSIPGWLQWLIDQNFPAVGTIAAAWAVSQGQDIYGQLCSGVRYLDLRLARKGDEIWLLHGLYSVNVDVMLSDVARFTSENQREIIILDINHLYDFDNDLNEIMALKLQAVFGSKLLSKQAGVEVTIGNIWKENAQLLVLYEDETTVKKYDWLWSEYLDIYAPYYAATTVDELIAALHDRAFKTHDSFFYLHGQLTPDTKTIAAGLLPGQPHSLYDLANSSNPGFMNWLKANYNPALNIIATDWIDHTDLVSFAILINKSLV